MRNFDRAASIYDSTRSLPESVMNAVVDALEFELKGAGPILDAGVGTGRFAAPLKKRGLDVTGVDVSKEMLLVARSKSVPSLVRSELTRMPFIDNSFDSCLLIHVLHLMDDPGALLREISRVCRSEVLSVSESSESLSVRAEYIRLLSEMGYEWTDFNERKLAKLIPPTRLRYVTTFNSERSADDEISYFRKRLSAVTWEVDDDVHAMIIDRLEASFGGRTLKSSTTIKLTIWDRMIFDEARLLVLPKGSTRRGSRP